MKSVWETKIANSPWIGGCAFDFIDDGDRVILPCEVIHQKIGARFHFIKLDKKSGAYQDSGIVQKPEQFISEVIWHEKVEYKTGNKTVHSKNSYFVQCVENGKQLWQIRHRGFLYTDIVFKNGCAIFGTDGMGGGLYCVEADTGKVLCDVNTGGTTFYDWVGEEIVLFARNRLVRVDPFTSRIADEYPIGRIFPYHTVIKAIDGFVYGVVFTDDNQATILCVEL